MGNHAVVMDDLTLLRRYLDERSQPAFAELVQRHLGLVYFAALRQTGDRALAEDVAQEVFTDLARKAATLVDRAALTGWLYTSTRFAAINARRGELRRRRREAEAQLMENDAREDHAPADAQRLRPLIDDALHALEPADRDAVLLRFFQNRAFAEIGAVLRISDEAARKRVDRALDKLAAVLARRGVTSTAAALGTALGAQAAGALPSGLAASIAGTAVAASAGAGAKTGALVAGGVLAFMTSTKLILGSLGLAAAASALAVSQHRGDQAAQVELAAVTREAAMVHARVRELEQRRAAAEQRARVADADGGQLLKAIQDAAPRIGFPAGDAACIAFVIDTSGSMRNPRDGKLWTAVQQAIDEALAMHPDVRHVMLFDAAGRVMSAGAPGWLPLNAETRAAIADVLQRYDQDSISNPVPGIYRAMRELPPRGANGARLHVCVIGDEFIEQVDPVLRRLDEINVADFRGQRPATISAIQLPTTIRYGGHGNTANPMANTGVKFQSLMTEVAKRHAGTFKLMSVEVLQP